MKELVYTAVVETGSNPDVGRYLTYGILGERMDPVTRRSIDRRVIHDVTTKRDLAEKIVGICERNQVSLIHLKEVVEDILYIEL